MSSWSKWLPGTRVVLTPPYSWDIPPTRSDMVGFWVDGACEEGCVGCIEEREHWQAQTRFPTKSLQLFTKTGNVLGGASSLCLSDRFRRWDDKFTV